MKIIDSPYRYIPFFIVLIIGYWLSRNNPFFWDTVQFGSEHAHWYYENSFRHFLLPVQYDSGHPPLFGMYIALWWKAFGKSLAVSHLSMMPFALVSVYFLFRIADKWIQPKYSFWFVLLCFADPVTASQHILVSPDVVLYTGTLVTFYGILYEKKIAVLAGTLLLSCISMRGVSIAAALGAFQVFSHFMQNKPFKKEYLTIYLGYLWPYVPGLILFGSFMVYHYYICGWIGYHKDSPWAASFERVDIYGVLRNIVVTGFRLVEVGRIGLVVVLVSLIIKYRNQWRNVWPSLLLLLLLTIFLILPQLAYRELLGLRYFMPVFLVLSLLFCQLLLYIPSEKIRRILYAIVLIVFITGNFWRYPRRIAMGWDATLSHVFYFAPRAQMKAYIETERIPYHKIGCPSLEYNSFEYMELNGDTSRFQPIDIDHQTYIYYSSVMNLSDEILDKLSNDFYMKKVYDNAGINVILYERNTK